MKQFAITILFFTLCLSLYPQSKSDDKERVRIANSKILKSNQWTYKYAQGKLSTKGYITTESKFDERGNVTEVINYKSTGQISSKLLYQYDKNNNRIEYQKFEKRDKPEIELTYKQNFTYDDKGNKKIETGFDGITTYRIVYNYLPDGKSKDITKYNADNSINEKWESTYNDNVQTINVLKQGKTLDYTLTRKTDSKDNIIEEVRKDSKGKEVSRTTFEFDGSNNISSSAEYYSGKISKTFQYKYNSKKQLAEIIQVNPDGTKTLSRAYKYDEKGNVLEEKWFDGVPSDLSSKNYKYNEKLNPAEVESYYSDYKYKVLYKYTYEYY
ncbi:MAG: hypothetical protein HXX16_06980 [Bacteroidales bacterium]|nr:hypothetical protein [Bacteroidales bacterium]